MQQVFNPVAPGSARLLPGELLQRYELNRRYLLSLRTETCCRTTTWRPASGTRATGHRHPLGLGIADLPGARPRSWATGSRPRRAPGRWHGDTEIKGKADHIVAELARCQAENGGEWAGSIPEKYLDWIARGKTVWAPQYVSTRP